MLRTLAQQRWRWLLLVAVAALQCLFSTANSYDRDLNTDEAFTAIYTRAPDLPTILDDVRKNEETPPVYFIVIWLWSRVVGSGEMALRSLSMLLGLLAGGLFCRFAVRWLPPAEAVAASLAAVVFVPLINFMPFARSYMLMMALLIGAISLFERLYREPGRGWLYVPYTLVALALALTHYFGATILVAHNLLWAGSLIANPHQRRRRIVFWSASQLAVLAVTLAWLPSLLYQLRVAPAVTLPGQQGLLVYVLLLFNMLVNLYRPPSPLVWMPFALVGWLVIALGLRHARRLWNGALWRAAVVPTLVLLPVIAWTAAYGARYMLTFLIAIALGFAAGWGVIYRRNRRLALGVGGLLLIVFSLNHVIGVAADPQPKAWAALTERIAQAGDPSGDCVITQAPWDARIFAYYYRGPEMCLLGAYNYDDFYLIEGHSMTRSWTAEEAAAATGGKLRVWVFNNAVYADLAHLDLPYVERGRWRSGLIELTLYENAAR